MGFAARNSRQGCGSDGTSRQANAASTCAEGLLEAQNRSPSGASSGKPMVPTQLRAIMREAGADGQSATLRAFFTDLDRIASVLREPQVPIARSSGRARTVPTAAQHELADRRLLQVVQPDRRAGHRPGGPDGPHRPSAARAQAPPPDRRRHRRGRPVRAVAGAGRRSAPPVTDTRLGPGPPRRGTIGRRRGFRGRGGGRCGRTGPGGSPGAPAGGRAALRGAPVP